MAISIGAQIDVGYSKETTRGTAITSNPAYWLKANPTNIKDDPKYAFSRGAAGNIAGLSAARLARNNAMGDIEGEIFTDPVGLEFLALCGDVDSVRRTGAGVTLYDHTFILQLGSNEHQSLTVTYSDPVQQYRIAETIINTWNFDFNVDSEDFIMRTMNVLARAREKITPRITPSAPQDTTNFVPTEAGFKMANTEAGLSAASDLNVLEGGLEVNKNAVGRWRTGAANKTFARAGNLRSTITGSFKLDLENLTQNDLVFNGTPQALEYSMSNGASGNDLREIKFILPLVYFPTYEFDRDVDNPLGETINWEAAQAGGGTDFLKIILTNEITAY